MTAMSELTEISSCDDDDSSPGIVKEYKRTMQENLRESYSQNETLHRTKTPVSMSIMISTGACLIRVNRWVCSSIRILYYHSNESIC